MAAQQNKEIQQLLRDLDKPVTFPVNIGEMNRRHRALGRLLQEAGKGYFARRRRGQEDRPKAGEVRHGESQ